MKISKKDDIPPKFLADMLKEKAIQLSKTYEYEESYKLFMQSSKIWKELGNLRQSELMIANALDNKGRFYRNNKNFDEYRKYLLKSAKKWHDLDIINNELWCLALYYQSMANAMRQDNHLIKEREYLMKAIDAWNKLDNNKNILRCQANYNQSMANTMNQENNFVKEREYELKAFKIWNDLGNKRNALRCQANYYSSLARDEALENKYDEAINDYKKAIRHYNNIDDKKSSIWCEVKIDLIKANIMTNIYEFLEASNIKFDASEKLINVGIKNEAKHIEAHAWSDLATHKKRNNNYDESISDFKKASELYSQINNYAPHHWCEANISECLYLKSKFGGSIKTIIKHLKNAINSFEKGNDIIAVNILSGDLNKYEGLYLKSSGNLKEAYIKFNLSYDYYTEAYKKLIGKKSSILQQDSVRYAQALIKNTAADIEFIINVNLTLATKYYKQASELFKISNDYKSVEYCDNLYYLSNALNNALKGNYEESIVSWNRVSNIYGEIVTKPFPKDFNRHKMIDLLSTLTKLIVKRAEEEITELIESDKGPSFESRIRELISQFDGREYNDFNGEVFNLGKNHIITLHKYNDIKEININPNDDEIGIVFKDKTPVNIDIFGKRIIKNRSYLIIGECKNRPNYKIKIDDVKLLNKKSKFIKFRYDKIERLEGRHKPIIEKTWYFSTGSFTEKAKLYSVKENIILINKNGINKLLKAFGMKNI